MLQRKQERTHLGKDEGRTAEQMASDADPRDPDMDQWVKLEIFSNVSIAMCLVVKCGWGRLPVDVDDFSTTEDVRDRLAKMLAVRPEPSSIMSRGLVHGSALVDRSLQATVEQVSRQRELDQLARRLKNRPTPHQMVEKGILRGECILVYSVCKGHCV